jgi:CheY-like chemotaxis protein
MYAKNNSNIAIVPIDMMMPNLDPRATIQTLRQINSQVKIAVMSGSYHNLESAIELPNVSAALTKPFTTANLLQALTNIQLE